MPDKTSNKIKKLADTILRTLTNEEFNSESERYRDKDDKKYTRGPRDEK